VLGAVLLLPGALAADPHEEVHSRMRAFMDKLTDVYVFVTILAVVHLLGYLVPRFENRSHKVGCCVAFLLRLAYSLSAAFTLVYIVQDYVNRNFELDNPHAPLYIAYFIAAMVVLVALAVVQLAEFLVVWGVLYLATASSDWEYTASLVLWAAACAYFLPGGAGFAKLTGFIAFTLVASYWIVMAFDWLAHHATDENDPLTLRELRYPALWQGAAIGVIALLRLALVAVLELRLWRPWYAKWQDELKDAPAVPAPPEYATVPTQQ